jgi:hypothetical protein
MRTLLDGGFLDRTDTALVESRKREDPSPTGGGARTDSKGPVNSIHQLRNAGARVTDCQAGSQTEQADQTVCTVLKA